MSFTRTRWCRATAVLLSLAVLHCAPGLAAYSALAANLKAAPVSAGNGVSPIRAGSMALGSANFAAPAALLAAPSLTGSLNMAPTGRPILSVPSNAPAADAPVAAADSILAAAAPRAALTAPVAAAADAPVAPVTAVAALQETMAAVTAAAPAEKAPSAAGLSAAPLFGKLFDGWRARRADLAAPVSAAADAPAFTPLSAPADAPSAHGAQPPVPPSAPGGPKSSSRVRVTVGLALAVGGGVAAWFAAPVLVPLLLAGLGYLPVAVPVLPAVAYQSIVTALGVGAGLAAFSTKTWTNFPADLRDTAVGAARTTFRFWARFGLIFDAVLRGKSTDDVMKGDVSANLFAYPLIAWPFVAVGYVFVPVAFVLGAAWRVIGTPILAALRGAKEVAVGFFPWLARLFRFLGNVLRNFLPFLGGFLWGAVRGLFYGGAAGAVVLAGPVFRDVVAAQYAPRTLPGWVAYRLLQLGGLIATLGLGAAGFVAGVVFSPLHALMSAFERAFAWSDASAGAEAFFKRWMRALSEDKGFTALIERSATSTGSETLAARGSRLLNGTLTGAALLFTVPFLALATLARSLYAAARGETVQDSNFDWEKQLPAKGAERAVEGNPGFALPVVLGLLGVAAGVFGYATFAPASIIFGGAAGLALWAGAGVFGGVLGLALSQPWALRSVPGAVASDAARAGQLAWGAWLDTGRRAVVAVTGVEKAAPLGVLLAVVPAAVMAVVSGLVGAAHGLTGTLGKASWKGFMETVRRFIPALRRFFSFVARVLKNVLPFAFGFIWGAVTGLFKTAFGAAIALFLPLAEAGQAESDANTRPSEAQMGMGAVLALTLLPLAAAVFVGGLALGAALGLPVIATFAVSRGVKWARPSATSVAYFNAWERTALPRAMMEATKSVRFIFEGVGPEMPIWRLYVRFASALLGSPVTAVVLLLAGYKAFAGSFREAGIAARGEKLPELSDGSAGREPVETPEAPAAVPAGKPPVVIAAVMGAVGLAAGVASVFFVGLPFLAGLAGWTLWAGYAGVFAGLPLLGLAAGLAVTQPVFWKNILPLGLTHAKAGMTHSYAYWKNSGDAAFESLLGVKRGSLLTVLHRVVGAALGAVWAVAGAVYGAGAAFLTGAYEGARQVVYEILPALRVAFETAMKVLRRVVPFVFGLLAGAVSGVVGSAAFGALLLGRPYFKHVVAQDFEKSGVVGALGNLFLKLVALALGVAFGLGGVVIGVIVAAPYALTGAVSLAFRFADIGGPAQRFFDHWTFGALREEMRRINQLTAKFQFDDAPEGREPGLAAGWIRMANVFPATLAAIFAAGIAGLVSYFRSLGSAYKSSVSGQPIPEPTVDEQSRREWDRTWNRAGRTARGFFGWAIAGAVVAGAVALFTSWTPLGLAGWLLVGAAAGLGVALALGLAGVIALVALLFWIGGQLR
ncbi:MAG: hypothetical protein SF051_16010 [Elusimicrobiota bacterium]|nr:hypothetical protein [Elusimicrobiota bacterium]